MTQDEMRLLDRLLATRQSISARDPRKRTKSAFLLDYGSWYTPITLPANVRRGKKNQCFANAFWLAFDNPSLIYVEGVALDQGANNPTHHAWVTDGKGNAIDSTWDELGMAYAGVPFNLRWLNDRHVLRKAIVCVLDDWENHWPILCELGDRPQEWLDERGVGTAKLSDE
jgi:hypothetical protein